jgi:surfactin synthase thioesterase subunit
VKKPSADSGLWIRRYHPAPDRPVRLVLLPHAGGSAGYYFPFSKRLSAHADVLCVQYPGRADRLDERCVDDLEELADEVFTNLLPWLDRPIVLCGHSLGATVAYEVARRLEYDKDIVPLSLVVSSHLAPGDVRDGGVHRRDDDGLVRELLALSGTDQRFLTSPVLRRRVLKALRGDYRAGETYVHRPGPLLRCPVTALVGDADPKITVTQAWNWADYSTGPFTMDVFAGGHFYLAEHRAGVVAAITRSFH